MESHTGHSKARLFPLTLGALGIVFGDIGTSPLYAMTECFARNPDGSIPEHALAVTQQSVFGVLSLFFWALMMVVTVKYQLFVLRASNRGEGGMFALLALVPPKSAQAFHGVLIMAALFGAALLYGDGIITPSISVLSAVEGLSVATHRMDRFVVPLTVIILLMLFLVQKRGTDRIGRAFGPVMVVWFVVLAVLGVKGIIQNPQVLEAVSPKYAFDLLAHDPGRGFRVLGSVVLCVTGGEALYADMGHFGTAPIRWGWFAVVLPALLLNYFGQGAYLMAHGWVEKPFWALVPQMALYPMVGLSTFAAVIASQALISGAFSLTRQAVQLGYLPRVTIIHTSSTNEGQIYVPEVNTAIMIACIALVIAFRKSTELAAAYGVAVTGTMIITSIIYFVVLLRTWKWPLWRALPLLVLFLFFDLPFFLSTALKFLEGGWVPVAVGLAMFALMTTWKRGRSELAARFRQSVMPLEALLEDIKSTTPHRVRGTAVFMSGNPDGTPPVLLHHLKHNQVLHRQVVLLSIVQENVPQVAKDEQIEVKEEEQGFYRVIWRTGFMETPNVPRILKRAREEGLVVEPSTTSYFLGRETLLTTGKSHMMRWRKMLFAFISRNALPATTYFAIPAGRVVELGMQVEL